MKKCFLLLAGMLLAVSAGAANKTYNIVSIHLKDSSKVDVVINNNVKMNFTDTHLVVEGGETEVSVERAKLDKFTHSYKAGASVEELGAADKVNVQGDKVVFYALPANTPVSVYALSGAEVISVIAEGDYVLDLSGLESGIYVVNAQGNSIKVTVK